MGDLRKTWQAFKEKSLTEFKKANPVKDIAHIEVYPLKFKLALGDALDSWEKAKSLKIRRSITKKHQRSLPPTKRTLTA